MRSLLSLVLPIPQALDYGFIMKFFKYVFLNLAMFDLCLPVSITWLVVVLPSHEPPGEENQI